MKLFSKTSGIALLVDRQGIIERILFDDLGISDTIAPGQLVIHLVDRASLSKAFSMLAELQTRGVLFDWEMNVPIGEQISALHFAGGAVGNHYLIVAAANSKNVTELFEEMVRINNELTNLIRQAAKGEPLPATISAADSTLYDEISLLNNQIIAAQRDLIKKNAELERLNQLKNQYLGMAAHDLRSPLQYILACSEYLIHTASDQLTPQQNMMLATIKDSTKFMANLVTDLLDISQIESGKLTLALEPLDLQIMLQENVKRNRLIAEMTGKWIELVDNPVPIIQADPVKIDQVLNNLIDNAIKYSPTGGLIQINLTVEQDSILLRIQDHGIGIPANEMGRLFKPFGKTSGKSPTGEKSVGLGLYICQRIISGHGGRIWLESAPGEGTTAFVSLPAR